MLSPPFPFWHFSRCLSGFCTPLLSRCHSCQIYRHWHWLGAYMSIWHLRARESDCSYFSTTSYFSVDFSGHHLSICPIRLFAEVRYHCGIGWESSSTCLMGLTAHQTVPQFHILADEGTTHTSQYHQQQTAPKHHFWLVTEVSKYTAVICRRQGSFSQCQFFLGLSI